MDTMSQSRKRSDEMHSRSNHTSTPGDLQLLLDRMEALERNVSLLVERQRAQSELFEEAMPIFKEALGTWGAQLQSLEERGYFAFGRELLGVVDRVVTGFSPSDVRELGDNVVRILSLVKRATSGNALGLADRAALALDKADPGKEVGVLGMLRATRDDDVKRGVAILLEVLRQVGRVREDRAEGQRRDLARMLGPSRKSEAQPAPPPKRDLGSMLAPSRSPAPANVPSRRAEKAPAPAVACASITIGSADPDWTREKAVEIAKSLGIPELSDIHWQVIEFCRSDYQACGASPNIRRITLGCGVSTRDLYALFPKAPGQAAAQIAGVPKPGGCL